jgi:hypothetical protein
MSSTPWVFGLIRDSVATLRTVILSALLLGLHEIGGAQQVVIVQRNVNLRRDPSTNQPRIRLLLPPEELELLDSTRTNNYYHVVREESADTGWVWANNVRVALGSPATTAVAAAIDSTWSKGTPVSGTFTSPVRSLSCGPTGDGSDTSTNRLKNRTDIPSSYHPVAFDAIGDLLYPATSAQSRLNWPAESLAVIRRYEGVALTVVGWLVALKPQTGGSGEATNCSMTRSSEVDWHVALVEAQGQGEAESVVVETTPRVRVSHPKWTPGRLGPWVDSADPVRISGWLMFDPQHRNHLGRFRKTLWEVHPITRIEVWSNGQWVDVDNLP